MYNESKITRNILDNLPYDIISEIFIHCTQQSSVRALFQSDTKIAPLLLCQVCSTWRAMALSSPILWSHIRFELFINWDRTQGHPITWDPEAFDRRLEWLRWWRQRLGSMAPYLQVEVRPIEDLESRYVDQKGRLTEASLDFLYEFLSSAQGLSVGRLFRYLIHRRVAAGFEVQTHPNLHTWQILLRDNWMNEPDDSYNYCLASVLAQTPSTLRRLLIEDADRLRPQDYKNLLPNWSSLTHLALKRMVLYLNTWFSFIRSLRGLQSGFFFFCLLDEDIKTYVDPRMNALPYLSVLHVSVQLARNPAAKLQYPLSAVFTNLKLPALRTLSLDSKAKTWRNSSAIQEVHAALQSAPSVTKLFLGEWFLGGQAINVTSKHLNRLKSIIRNVGRLSTHAPRLEHIGFCMCSPLRRHGAFPFAERIFASSRWVDLRSPKSTIQKVTLVSSYITRPEDMLTEKADRRLLISAIRKHVRDDVSVTFLEDEHEEDKDDVQRSVWGW